MSFSRSSKPQSGGVSAPTSSAKVVTLRMWLRMRPISQNSTRMELVADRHGHAQQALDGEAERMLLASSAPDVCAPSAPCSPLTNFLQSELYQVATLTAQMNALQQCDPVAAALLASYIPDHQAQASALSALITCQGGSVPQPCPLINPCLGSRAQMIQNDIQLQAQTVTNYAWLKCNTCDPATAQLATIGEYRAARHLDSLLVALSVTCITPTSAMDGLQAQLMLEVSAIADLQSQQARLCMLGQTQDVNQFNQLIAQHEQQVTSLQTAIAQMCGYPGLLTAPPVYMLSTRDDIYCQERITETQFINTYALVTATLPPSPLRAIAAQGQSFSLASLAFVEANAPTPTSVAAVAATPASTAQSAALPQARVTTRPAAGD